MLDPIYLGLTRATVLTKWGLPIGVSFEAFVACAITTALAVFVTKNPAWLALYPALHAGCWGIEQVDPRAFRLLRLWVLTKGRCLGTWIYWKGHAAYSPFPKRRY